MTLGCTRRAVVGALALPGWGAVFAGDDMPGPVRPPRAMPALTVTSHDGRRSDLRDLLRGRVTALQFVLTGCSSTCNVLGFTFQQAQQALGAPGDDALQFASVAIDPLGDTPATLAAWRRRFNAGPAWHTVVPDFKARDTEPALRRLGAGVPGGDGHAARVLVVDRAAQVVLRTSDFPDAQVLVHLLRETALG